MVLYTTMMPLTNSSGPTLGWVKFLEWKKTGCSTVVAKYVEDPKLTIF